MTLINGQFGGTSRSTMKPIIVDVGGIPVKVTPGSPGGMWSVEVSGFSTALTEGADLRVNKVRVILRNNELYINGERVALDGTAEPREVSAQLKKLRQDFPGATFIGEPSFGAIGPDVTFAPGARVDFSTGELQIFGKSEIGPGAFVSGSMRLEDVTLSANSSITGNGSVTRSVLKERAQIVGNARVLDSLFEAGAQFIGNGEVNNSTIQRGEQLVSNGKVFRGNGLGLAPAERDSFEQTTVLVRPGSVSIESGSATVIIGNRNVGY